MTLVTALRRIRLSGLGSGAVEVLLDVAANPLHRQALISERTELPKNSTSSAVSILLTLGWIEECEPEGYNVTEEGELLIQRLLR